MGNMDRILEGVGVEKPSLERLFKPRSIAVVGASESQPQSRNLYEFMVDSDVDLFMVNPNRETVFGLTAHSNLAAIGRPVDAVLGLVNAPRTVELVAEALSAGAGGVIAHAGGFSEAGDAGKELQRKLVAAAQGRIPVLGPNCNGYVDINRRIKASGSPNFDLPGGSIGLIAQSGSLMSAIPISGAERLIGFSHIISSGNEAMVDMADCIEFLVGDDNTRAIALVVEVVRNPSRFLAAVRRAVDADKPVVALKLGRGARAQAIVNTHTGSIAGEAWEYEAVFRQHGVLIAQDVADLADKLVYFDQLPRERWSRMERVSVLTPSGGGASLVSDRFGEHGIRLSDMTEVDGAVQKILPGAKVLNPLDMTGFVVTQPAIARELLDAYVGAADSDGLLLQWFTNDSVMSIGRPFLSLYEELPGRSDKTLLLGSFDDARIGEWACGLPGKGIGVTRGLEGTARSIAAMGQFVRFSERLRSDPDTDAAPIPVPDAVVPSAIGPILSFDATMRLLADCGLRVAPYHLVHEDASPEDLVHRLRASLGAGPFVAKLAEVPHRTEVDALRMGVTCDKAGVALQELQALAVRLGVPRTVAFQRQLASDGEAFVGIKGDAALGPMVIAGVGGIFVEIFRKVAGLAIPFSRADALEALHDLDETRVFEGVRGKMPWKREELCDLMVAAGRLASSGRGWIRSIDVNPLILTDDGFLAVDGLCTVHGQASN